MAFVGYVS